MLLCFDQLSRTSKAANFNGSYGTFLKSLYTRITVGVDSVHSQRVNPCLQHLSGIFALIIIKATIFSGFKIGLDKKRIREPFCYNRLNL